MSPKGINSHNSNNELLHFAAARFKGRISMVKNKKLWIILFIAPTALIFALVFLVPLITVFVTSLCSYSPFQSPRFIGFENFKTLFLNNSDFWQAISNTIVWILLQITVSVSIGVLIALLLYKKPFGWKFVRASYMIPNIIPTAATGLMFYLLLNPDLGIVKGIFTAIGREDLVPNLFGNSSYTFLTVTATWIFYSAFNTVLIMSEIGTIPTEIFESAKVDGATELQIDFYITLPMLKSILTTCVILASVSMISQFDILYMTTKGGPGNSTLNLPLYLFKTANLEMNYGLANAIGVVQILFGLLLVFTINKIAKIGKENR